MQVHIADQHLDRRWGRIINVSSVNGSKGAVGQTNDSAAKAGVHGFTKALALEVARKGVTVNTISPGYIGTKMVMAIPTDVLDSKILPQNPLGRRAMQRGHIDRHGKLPEAGHRTLLGIAGAICWLEALSKLTPSARHHLYEDLRRLLDELEAEDLDSAAYPTAPD